MTDEYQKELYWEDFPVGKTFKLGCYFLSKKELIDFATQYDPQDFHIDEEKAKLTPMGVLCASGLQTVAICQRLTVKNLTERSALVAGVAMNNLKFNTPVLPDETLRAELTITEARRLSDGKRGLIRFEKHAYNPRNECVMSLESGLIMMCREAITGTQSPALSETSQ